ncbi:MASE1 domain-containing protein [Novosphingobium sp. B1]|uniref:MASE1 domain-containing protein n=1 Tax=Novosphingobium sp. B1 TaxID=1938756 RepID=UPI0009D7DB86|nr:MASE1 domain-containing protein [Novosphingobium sp. B1]SMC32488.1 Integral membrane sensor domain MASE1 [Novosphingobium sp. B1]
MKLARVLSGPAATAIVYFVLAAGSVAFARFSGGVAMAWTASAFLAGRLIHLPEQRWSAWMVPCGVASALATGLLGLGWFSAGPFAVINIAEAAGAAWLWRRITKAFWPYDTLEWIASYYIGIALMLPLLTGALAACAGWLTLDLPLVENFTHWIIGHSLGLLACLPIFHYVFARLSRGRSFLPSTAQLPLAAVVVGSYALLTFLVFTLDMRALLVFPLIYLVVSAAVLPGSITAILPVIMIGVGGGMTILGQGPIAGMEMDFGDRIQFFQLYLGVSVFAAFPITCERLRRMAEMRTMQRRIAALEAGQTLP